MAEFEWTYYQNRTEQDQFYRQHNDGRIEVTHSSEKHWRPSSYSTVNHLLGLNCHPRDICDEITEARAMELIPANQITNKTA